MSTFFASPKGWRPYFLRRGSMSKVMEKEAEIFDANLKIWRKDQMGQFVLIKGDKVIGFFDSLDGAFKKGTETFGLDNFFVKQVFPADSVNISFFGRSVVAS